MSEPTIGVRAPVFSAPDQTGTTINSADFAGRTVVLYFYPKDDTPGCTTQACSFRDSHAAFGARDTVVLGVSPDNATSHVKFIKKFGLPFSLLSDPDHQIAEAYRVWVEKSMYGKKYMGVERSTFVIGPDGKIVRIYRKVKPEQTVAEILKDLEAA